MPQAPSSMPSRIPSPLPLILGLVSLGLFVPGIFIMDSTRAWMPTLGVAVPALILGAGSMALGVRVLRGRPVGGRYGWAMTGSLCGGFSMLFWICMVPMLLIVALPARDLDPGDPQVELSREQMKVWVRHIKTFERDHARMPVKLEELVEKGYAREALLYDPRQRRRDAPSYRLMVRELPPQSAWSTVPILEGRIPDADGHRLAAFPDETVRNLDSAPTPVPQ